ncbi:MAG TPA: patatin-like phospholipase family protein [Casimicrobiaceae bacterium]|jgi:NTE family protein
MKQNESSSRIRKPVGLALQGAGSWGAYTWGVLDVLLASRTLAISQLSGTSAGAINAAIVAGALAHGPAKRAREALRSFWLDVAYPINATAAGEMWAPVERAWRESIGAWLLSSGGSPYQLNPLGINPLRDLIARHVDIDALRSPEAPAIYVTLTNVKTGLPRVVTNAAMTVDALVASACLPQLFQAVEIDGEPYWDGGYSGNPTLWPMIHGGGTRDLIVVQLVPDEVESAPTDATGIRRRVGEIVFNSSLVAEMQAISAMRALAGRSDGDVGIIDTRLHRIGPPPTALLMDGSALERSRQWLLRLHAEGRRAAQRFIARHSEHVGIRETLDVARVFAGGHYPTMRRPANEDLFDQRRLNDR